MIRELTRVNLEATFTQDGGSEHDPRMNHIRTMVRIAFEKALDKVGLHGVPSLHTRTKQCRCGCHRA